MISPYIIACACMNTVEDAGSCQVVLANSKEDCILLFLAIKGKGRRGLPATCGTAAAYHAQEHAKMAAGSSPGPAGLHALCIDMKGGYKTAASSSPGPAGLHALFAWRRAPRGTRALQSGLAGTHFLAFPVRNDTSMTGLHTRRCMHLGGHAPEPMLSMSACQGGVHPVGHVPCKVDWQGLTS
eukprot:1156516-Pelagomonas_calceolata.AAC.2